MALLNVRSLSNKFFVINELISEHKLDRMFLTETWLNSDRPAVLIERSPQCYSFEHSTKNVKKGGGTASIFADPLNCRNIPIGDFRSFEHQQQYC